MLDSNIMYAVKMPSGKWLDSRYRHDRESDKPRLFVTPGGARNSLGNVVTPSIRALLPEHLRDWHRPAHTVRWDDKTYQMNREFWKAAYSVIKSLKGQSYWDMLAKDGYILTEFKIKEAQ